MYTTKTTLIPAQGRNRAKKTDNNILVPLVASLIEDLWFLSLEFEGFCLEKERKGREIFLWCSAHHSARQGFNLMMEDGCIYTEN